MTFLLETIRNLGWMVAVHNDYTTDGTFHTFWLFTNSDGMYVKGEGQTDDQALQKCLDQIRKVA